MGLAKKVFACTLCATFYTTSLFADMITTQEILHTQPKSKIDTFLEKKEVEAKLASLGVNKEVLKERIASLTPDEISQINKKIDTMPAGGDFGAVIGVLAFIFVLLIITDVLGFTKVFTFTRPVR